MLKSIPLIKFLTIVILSISSAQISFAIPKASHVTVSPTVINEGASSTITGYISISGSEVWTGGVLVIYATPPGGSEFSIGTIDSSLFSGNSASLTHTPNMAGQWKFRAQMQGGFYNYSNGQSGGVDTALTSYANLTVNPSTSGANPVVSLFTGTPGKPYVGDEVLLAATVSDSDGTISHVQFKAGNTVIATDSTAPYTCKYTRATPGSITFTATAQDNDGLHDSETELVTWKSRPYSSLYGGADRWVDVNNDGLIDFIEDIVLTEKDEPSFENYFYGAPAVGTQGGLVFNDFSYHEYCYYYYNPIQNYLWDFVWDTWGFFGDRWSWYGSWYAPNYIYDCDYEITSVSSRFEYYAAQSGRKYQIQKSASKTTPSWINVGGPITAAINSISRSIGEWDGIAYSPDLIRIALLNEALAPGAQNFTDRAIADQDGDGVDEVERTITQSEILVDQTTNSTIIDSVTGKLKKILKIKIPVGIAINPTGSGNVLGITVKEVGRLGEVAAIEHILTGEISSPIELSVVLPGDSKIEVQIIFRSSPTFAIWDLNNVNDANDDEWVAPWDKSKPIANDNIAWIDAHTSTSNPNPRMPQLRFNVPGLQSGSTVEAKFEVSYLRKNANSGTPIPQDLVQIPSGGGYSAMSSDTWDIFTQYNTLDFFGGDATLTYRIKNSSGNVVGQPHSIKFRIGGQNPTDGKIEAYINSQPNAGATDYFWYAWAVAKSETSGKNGTNSFYNQFLELPIHKIDVGRPVWGNDGPSLPGGYGLYQISDAITPSKQLWNWQDNVKSGLAILATKRLIGNSWMTKQKNTSNANGVPLPSHQVRNVIFADGTNRTMNHAVTMKLFNGASKPPSSFIDNGTAPGFILDPHSSDFYCYWRNSSNAWALNRYNNLSINYVDRVCAHVP